MYWFIFTDCANLGSGPNPGITPAPDEKYKLRGTKMDSEEVVLAYLMSRFIEVGDDIVFVNDMDLETKIATEQKLRNLIQEGPPETIIHTPCYCNSYCCKTFVYKSETATKVWVTLPELNSIFPTQTDDNPGDNLQPDTPEDKLQPDTPEDNLQADTPEDNLQPDTPEDNLQPDTPEDKPMKFRSNNPKSLN